MTGRTRRIRKPQRTQSRGLWRRRSRGWIVIAAMVAVLALVFLSLLQLSRPGSPAANPSNPAQSTPSQSPSSSPSQPQVLARSVPTRVTISSIGLRSPLQTLSSNAGKTSMQLPPKPAQAGWFKDGSTPGQAGPTIIVGFITSSHGPGVFQHLGQLKVNAQISLTRTDATTVIYRVDKIATYTARQFPTKTIYADSPTSTLRLITCGGKLNAKQPNGNAVVFAHQIAIHPPTTP